MASFRPYRSTISPLAACTVKVVEVFSRAVASRSSPRTIWKYTSRTAISPNTRAMAVARAMIRTLGL